MDSAHFYPLTSKKGFSLLELLITIAIIGILAGGTLVAIDIPTQLARSRNAQRKTDLKSLQSALEIYRSDQRKYPVSLDLKLCAPLTGGASSVYMQKTPCEKKAGWPSYSYTSPDGGVTYTITACLEHLKNTADPDAEATTCGSNTNDKQYRVTNP